MDRKQFWTRIISPFILSIFCFVVAGKMLWTSDDPYFLSTVWLTPAVGILVFHLKKSRCLKWALRGLPACRFPITPAQIRTSKNWSLIEMRIRTIELLLTFSRQQHAQRVLKQMDTDFDQELLACIDDEQNFCFALQRRRCMLEHNQTLLDSRTREAEWGKINLTKTNLLFIDFGFYKADEVDVGELIARTQKEFAFTGVCAMLTAIKRRPVELLQN